MLDAKIEQTDTLIDVIVYELYGLTDEEIEIVEEALAVTPHEQWMLKVSDIPARSVCLVLGDPLRINQHNGGEIPIMLVKTASHYVEGGDRPTTCYSLIPSEWNPICWWKTEKGLV